jgi:hypothetical protein
MHSNFSSFKPRDSSFKVKDNSLWLRVNNFRYKVVKLRPKNRRDKRLLAWMLMILSIE